MSGKQIVETSASTNLVSANIGEGEDPSSEGNGFKVWNFNVFKSGES